ncbi:MAG: methionine biosynthesis protein MetW [Acidimicrobiaceae bacterium TMED244]|jgi:methionine biosynthesis protein MetW|nr:MAG: methionine biosynthesis protein MetW [Acidimicrobiaceae bacterium TMED244]|tara:strand:- start:195 stop:791 length:597 start_codon:yes stop_codon:yes gene_type:complete
MKDEFKVISDLIEDNKKVLDVGCADGTLMQFLKENKNINVRGLEISKEKVQECIAKGLTVIEGNAEKDLKQFPDKSFDYVVLSQTLQAFLSPELVLDELLRVGKKAIVTIPNFGNWQVRLHLLFKGTMPITKSLPEQWHSTPNLHMCTIKDFVNFIKSKEIKMIKTLALNNNNVSNITNNNLGTKNLFADLGIFLIEK